MAAPTTRRAWIPNTSSSRTSITSPTTPPTPWDFSYTPQVIVINLGQNDQCGAEPDDTMTASYVGFVQKLRATFPRTQIVALRPFGGPYEAAVRRAVETLNTAGDDRVHYIDTTGWLEKADFVDGVHPTQAGHTKSRQAAGSAAEAAAGERIIMFRFLRFGRSLVAVLTCLFALTAAALAYDVHAPVYPVTYTDAQKDAQRAAGRAVLNRINDALVAAGPLRLPSRPASTASPPRATTD